MRCKNTNKSQTNFQTERKFLFLSLVLMGFLAGGCAGTGLSSQDIWEKTKSTAQSAYVKTQRAVTNTLISIGKYQRENANGEQSTQETKTTPDKDTKNKRKTIIQPTETPRLQDRFPSRTPPAREESLSPGQARQTAKKTTQGKNSRDTVLAPPTTMAPEELRQRIQDIERERNRSKNPDRKRTLAHEQRGLEELLLKSQKEEDIIEEMEELRRRLRELQKDLLKIQKTNR